MSRLFDALQRSPAERSGITTLNLSSSAVESSETSEFDQHPETTPRTSLTCSSCKSPTPQNSLFCPRCNAFLGSVATERGSNNDSEPQTSIRSSEPRSTWVHVLWVCLRRFVALEPILILVILLYRSRIY
jgi:hypothetical protein